MARPSVEVYRQPHTDRWIAQCWEPECGWQLGADGGTEQKTYVRQQASSHRRKHRDEAKAEQP